MSNTEHEQQTPSGSPSSRRWLVVLASLGLVVGVEWLWHVQPATLTLFLYVPFLVWACAGVLVGLCHPSKRGRLSLIAIWLLLAMWHSEAVWSVPRGWFVAKPSGLRLHRVISLNCNVGSNAAAREVIPFKPQLVLLQETPGTEKVQELTRELWADRGSFIATPECSILAEGQLRKIAVGPGSDFVLAEWIDGNNEPWLIASLRLAPPCSRLDFWSPESRSEQIASVERRAETLKQLDVLIRKVQTLQHRVLIGGDFNMVAHDHGLQILSSRLVDSFESGGIGWGDSVLNDLPFQRFDQIWIDRSSSIGWMRCQAIRTQHSDHRLVLCDFGA